MSATTRPTIASLELRLARLERCFGVLRSPRNSHERITAIQCLVCKTNGLRLEELLSRARPERLAWPRFIAYALARKLTGISTHEIARAFRRRDHGTVLYGLNAVRTRCEADPRFARDLDSLTEELSRQFNEGRAN